MTNENIYLDIHVLQTVPSSNINRDDTGSPKTAFYGGVTRSRVSSQSWKRAMRVFFNSEGTETSGLRTKDVVKLLSQSIRRLDTGIKDEDAIAKSIGVLTACKIKIDKDNQTGALLLISRGQIQKIAQYVLDHETYDKKVLKEIFNGEQSLDLALFGRMVADNPELNVEGSAQVAHALSTHEVVPEFDYFTALDDLQPDDNAGASMLGTIEYNSSTLYRYANLNFRELEQNLGSDVAIKGALQYVKSFLLSMPTGKQNTFANKTLPSYVMVTIRNDTPVNLVSAFENPVKSNDGYVDTSIQRLESEYESTLQFVSKPLATVVLSKFDTQFGEKVTNLNVLLDAVSDNIAKVARNENDND
ncbi:type I-E CRISPR-associated protein Cas7/Cse4/CasC [Oenococcus sicerae]|uniref:Type I-E CRISPR-associated protein Cas7/Cse4/CasC n=1 Tax=Oenococcus sicerae TaxID=2203724 RepID=A0ABX5QPM2_9LACO|nr:type I-E CRISPR-associated protein Cas7/Cse4/CasC [Oenococcus sicerae]QAS70544.1 type I-E CRISPR-associated protein Cas7/Cse4/CasC [Oenococcus sicerae]